MIALAVSLAALALSLCAAGAVFVACRRSISRSRESFESLLAGQRAEWTDELAKIRLEQTEAARPGRRQAMQLFRSGMAPDTVAARLGLPKREMRLAAKVFAILSPR
jgi:hypothetical protein